MTIAVISRAAALSKVREALHLSPATVADEPSPPLISQALRRAAHILAPCPRHELERAVWQSLKEYSTDSDQFMNGTTETLDALLAYGEIIEMRAPADDPWSANRLIVRPAPPAFVTKKSGAIILLGVAGDEITPLSSEMNKRIEWHGVLRTLAPDGSEDLGGFLTELGLLELSERIWLRLPASSSAKGFCTIWRQRLAAASSPASAIDGLQVLDGRKSPGFYNGRWAEPEQALDGLHVARRRQRYGAPLWCLVDLTDGIPSRFLDLATRSDRERPCDIAWRVQMALDADCGIPQHVRLRTVDHRARLDFFSPIPSWAERRMAVVGERAGPEHSLFAYVIPQECVDEIIGFLQSYLWIASEASSKGEGS